jgi:uncharacterized membrane protein YccC
MTLRRPNAAPSDLARLPFALNPRGMSIAEGVRAAFAVAAIMAASAVVPWAPLREAALSALLTCLCDPGGPVRRRVPVLLGFSLLGAGLIAGVGLLRGLGPAVALPFGVVALFGCSFARVHGQAGQQLGGLLSVVIILALDQPLPGLGSAARVAASFLAGGLWATLLTLAIWQVHPYLPARRAVADVYAALARQVADLARLLADPRADATAWETHARLHRRAVRDAIEAARAIVLDMLRTRGAVNQRAMQSLIRLETADQIFGALIAMSDLLEPAGPADRAVAARLLRRLRPLLELLGRIIVTDDPDAHRRTGRAIEAFAADGAVLPADGALAAVARRIAERLRIAQTLALPANIAPGTVPRAAVLVWRQRLLTPFVANLVWRSPALRHALRTALAAAPALAFTLFWFTPYDHWLTITIVATMQPYFALTTARAIERVVGTVLGGLVAAGIGMLCTTPLAMAMAMFPLAIAALAVRTVNLGLFMLAVTPLIVLLVEVGAPGTSDWLIAAARAGFTAAGGVIAMAACVLLWPQRAPEALVDEARAAIGAHGRYAEAQFAALLDGGQATADEARRAAGVATNTLEAAITLALNDPAAGNAASLEAVVLVDAALRRLAGRLSALQLDPGARAGMAEGALRAWRGWIVGAMERLARGDAMLPPRPDVAASDAVGRIARQIELMGGALGRQPASL